MPRRRVANAEASDGSKTLISEWVAVYNKPSSLAARKPGVPLSVRLHISRSKLRTTRSLSKADASFQAACCALKSRPKTMAIREPVTAMDAILFRGKLHLLEIIPVLTLIA